MACRFDNFWFWCVKWIVCEGSSSQLSHGALHDPQTRDVPDTAEITLSSTGTSGDQEWPVARKAIISDHLRSSQRAMTRWIHRRDDVKTLDFSRTLWGISNSLQSSSSSAGGKEIAGADSHMLQLRCSHWKLPWASWAGGCLQRMKSTMQLHRIVEATFS